MSRGGWIEYRCRRCGAVDRSLHTPDVLTSVSELVVYGRVKSISGNPCHMLDTHRCADGEWGISDAIGGVEDPPGEGA